MDYQSLLLFVPVLLFSVIAHEYAHGYAALKQGDTTALMLGRLTWNPIKHIDPFLTIIMPAILYITAGVMLGGAKPVPVNPRNYRNYKRGDIIVSLAGVFVNFVLALICTVLIALFGLLGRGVPALASYSTIIQAMLIIGIQLNMILIAFNLIPIPPLDGSHVFKYLLPPAWAMKYAEFGRFGMLILIALLMVGRPILLAWMGPAFRFAWLLIGLVSSFILPGVGDWLPK